MLCRRRSACSTRESPRHFALHLLVTPVGALRTDARGEHGPCRAMSGTGQGDTLGRSLLPQDRRDRIVDNFNLAGVEPPEDVRVCHAAIIERRRPCGSPVQASSGADAPARTPDRKRRRTRRPTCSSRRRAAKVQATVVTALTDLCTPSAWARTIVCPMAPGDSLPGNFGFLQKNPEWHLSWHLSQAPFPPIVCLAPLTLGPAVYDS